MTQNDLILIQSMLKNLIEEAKSEYKKRNYIFKKSKLIFDAQNIPNTKYTEGFKEIKVEDDKPSISYILEAYSYDEKGQPIPGIFLSNVQKKINKLDSFKETIKNRFSISDNFSKDIEDEEIMFVIYSMFCSILQEYSDQKSGLKSLFEEKLDLDFLNRLLGKYLNQITSEKLEIELLIPIVGVKKGDYLLHKILDNNITIRAISKTEQEARLYELIKDSKLFGETEDDFSLFEPFNSNIVICIKEKLKNNSSLDLYSFRNRISDIYSKYHLKINSLINLISLSENHNSLRVGKIYFKCEGYTYNADGFPVSLWNSFQTKATYNIELFQRTASKSSDFLIESSLNKIFDNYNKLYNLSESKNRERIEGALYRRTKAIMDINESEGLLDSVIGIEQIFSGSHRNELTFRLSLYLANALYESDEIKTKKEIFDEVKIIYKNRSSLVHSGEHIKNEKALFYLEKMIMNVFNNDRIDLTSNETIASQIENAYLFN